MSFLDSIEKHFGSRELYKALGLEKGAGEGEVKKAYRRLSLKVHPDRVSPEEVDSATEKFQVLGKIYLILSDREKKCLYDEQGIVDEEDGGGGDMDKEDWLERWRLLFRRVTTEDIAAFELEYRGSQEEERDLRAAYLQCQGDMGGVLDQVMCARPSDEPRFKGLLACWIADGSLPDFPAFSGESKAKKRQRQRCYEKEKKEAEEIMNEMGINQDGDLKALIQAKQQSREKQRENFLDSLEAKYTTKKKQRQDHSSSGSESGKKSGRSKGKKGNKKP